MTRSKGREESRKKPSSPVSASSTSKCSDSSPFLMARATFFSSSMTRMFNSRTLLPTEYSTPPGEVRH